jgi:YggT family protein
MLNPFITLISNVISLVQLALVVWVVLDILLQFNIINRGHPLINKVYDVLTKLVDPMLAPIRRLLAKVIPANIGIDLSPIALILLLNFANNAMYSWFYTI